MKFTKEQVVEKITTKLGKTQKLSARTINDIVTNAMLFADDEMELDAFYAKVFPMVETTNNNFNKEQSDFVQDWEQKNSSKKGEGDPAADKNANSDMPKWYKEELARREKKEQELEAKLMAIESGKRSESLRSAALNKFKTDLKAELERNPKISERLEKRYAKVLATIADSDDENTLVARLTEEFNDAKELAGDGYIPSDGGATGGIPKAGADDPAVEDALMSLGVPKVKAEKKADQGGDD